jgi:hypothetical protein
MDFGRYKCETDAIRELSALEKSIVLLDYDCPIMMWGKVTDYKQTELNAYLFYY